MTGKIDPAVEAYLASVPDHFRPALEALRATIRAAAPEADEIIRYGQPTFSQDGHLVAYAAFSKHLSFFPMSSSVIARHADALKAFRTSPGTVQFTPAQPIPADIVHLMVDERLVQNRDAAQARQERRRVKRSS